MKMRKQIRMLCEAAIMIALAQVLSYIKLMELPNGGSLTPAMFPIIRRPLGPGAGTDGRLCVWTAAADL